MFDPEAHARSSPPSGCVEGYAKTRGSGESVTSENLWSVCKGCEHQRLDDQGCPGGTGDCQAKFKVLRIYVFTRFNLSIFDHMNHVF